MGQLISDNVQMTKPYIYLLVNAVDYNGDNNTEYTDLYTIYDNISQTLLDIEDDQLNYDFTHYRVDVA